MKNIIDIEQEKQCTEKAKARLVALIEKVFHEMSANYEGFNKRFQDAHALRASKNQFYKLMKENQLTTTRSIEKGLDKILRDENLMPPKALTFIKWCKDEDFGFPNFEEAYLISIKINEQFSEYKHDDDRVDTVIRHAIKQISSSSYRAMSADNARKTFKTYYEMALKQFKDGELKVIHKTLTEKTDTHASDKKRTDEARNKAMQEIKNMGFAINAKK